MVKESKHRRNEKKKPLLTIKEKRAKKHEKKFNKGEGKVNEFPIVE